MAAEQHAEAAAAGKPPPSQSKSKIKGAEALGKSWLPPLGSTGVLWLLKLDAFLRVFVCVCVFVCMKVSIRPVCCCLVLAVLFLCYLLAVGVFDEVACLAWHCLLLLLPPASATHPAAATTLVLATSPPLCLAPPPCPAAATAEAERRVMEFPYDSLVVRLNSVQHLLDSLAGLERMVVDR